MEYRIVQILSANAYRQYFASQKKTARIKSDPGRGLLMNNLQTLIYRFLVLVAQSHTIPARRAKHLLIEPEEA